MAKTDISDDGLINQTLSNYQVMERIASGGMGDVYKARHLTMDRIVAIKVIRDDVLESKNAVARFHKEVRAAAKLNHPNIVTAFDADYALGRHFLVLEYVSGKSLSNWARDGRDISLGCLIDLLIQAATGLGYAHEQGVIHRDVKPSNMLVTDDGLLKITDFGLVQFLDSADEMELTRSGVMLGSVGFLAPEQSKNSHVDQRADIYGLGCTLHYLLTGRPPYVGTDIVEMLVAHRQAPIPDLPEIARQVPGLQLLFESMVAKRAEDRPQSMDDVIQRLSNLNTRAAGTLTATIRRVVDENASDDTSPTAHATTRSLVSGKKTPRFHRWMASRLGQFVAFFLIVGIIWATWLVFTRAPAGENQDSGNHSNAEKQSDPIDTRHDRGQLAGVPPDSRRGDQEKRPGSGGNQSRSRQNEIVIGEKLARPFVVQYQSIDEGRGSGISELRKRNSEIDDLTSEIESAAPGTPELAELHSTRSLRFCDEGRFDLALSDLKRAIDLDSNQAIFFSNLGNVLMEMNDGEKAILAFSEAIKLEPGDSTYWNNRGNANLKTDRKKEALLDFSAAIEANPDDEYAYGNRGNLYRESGELDLAISDYTKAIEKSSAKVYYLAGRANAHLENGNEGLAIKDFRDALELDPGIRIPDVLRNRLFKDPGDCSVD